MTTLYRRNLPHIHPTGATFFVTFRLAGSLPQEVIERLRQEFQAEERQLATSQAMQAAQDQSCATNSRRSILAATTSGSTA